MLFDVVAGAAATQLAQHRAAAATLADRALQRRTTLS